MCFQVAVIMGWIITDGDRYWTEADWDDWYECWTEQEWADWYGEWDDWREGWAELQECSTLG